MATPSGVLIWAGANLSANQTFASTWSTYGVYYYWGDAKNACPSGWRLPTKDEVTYLVSNTYTGRTYFTSGLTVTAKSPGSGTLTFPSASCLISNAYAAWAPAGQFGFYWTQTANGTSAAWHLQFDPTNTTGTPWYVSDLTNTRCPVRCVRDCYRGYVK